MTTTGAPLQPTGHRDTDPTTAESPYIEASLFFTGEQEAQPSLVHRETSEAVALETGTWEFQQDLAFNKVTCTEYDWNARVGTYRTNNYRG